MSLEDECGHVTLTQTHTHTHTARSCRDVTTLRVHTHCPIEDESSSLKWEKGSAVCIFCREGKGLDEVLLLSLLWPCVKCIQCHEAITIAWSSPLVFLISSRSTTEWHATVNFRLIIAAVRKTKESQPRASANFVFKEIRQLPPPFSHA